MSKSSDRSRAGTLEHHAEKGSLLARGQIDPRLEQNLSDLTDPSEIDSVKSRIANFAEHLEAFDSMGDIFPEDDLRATEKLVSEGAAGAVATDPSGRADTLRASLPEADSTEDPSKDVAFHSVMVEEDSTILSSPEAHEEPDHTPWDEAAIAPDPEEDEKSIPENMSSSPEDEDEVLDFGEDIFTEDDTEYRDDDAGTSEVSGSSGSLPEPSPFGDDDPLFFTEDSQDTVRDEVILKDREPVEPFEDSNFTDSNHSLEERDFNELIPEAKDSVRTEESVSARKPPRSVQEDPQISFHPSESSPNYDDMWNMSLKGLGKPEREATDIGSVMAPDVPADILDIGDHDDPVPERMSGSGKKEDDIFAVMRDEQDDRRTTSRNREADRWDEHEHDDASQDLRARSGDDDIHDDFSDVVDDTGGVAKADPGKKKKVLLLASAAVVLTVTALGGFMFLGSAQNIPIQTAGVQSFERETLPLDFSPVAPPSLSDSETFQRDAGVTEPVGLMPVPESFTDVSREIVPVDVSGEAGIEAPAFTATHEMDGLPDLGIPSSGLPDLGIPVSGLPDLGIPVSGLEGIPFGDAVNLQNALSGDLSDLFLPAEDFPDTVPEPELPMPTFDSVTGEDMRSLEETMAQAISEMEDRFARASMERRNLEQIVGVMRDGIQQAVERAERAEQLALAQNEVLVDVVRLQDKVRIAEGLIVDLSRRIADIERIDPADRSEINSELSDVKSRLSALSRDVGLVARMTLGQTRDSGPASTGSRTQPSSPMSVYEGTQAQVSAVPTPGRIPSDVKVGDYVTGYGAVLDILPTADGSRLVVMENGSALIR